MAPQKNKNAKDQSPPPPFPRNGVGVSRVKFTTRKRRRDLKKNAPQGHSKKGEALLKCPRSGRKEIVNISPKLSTIFHFKIILKLKFHFLNFTVYFLFNIYKLFYLVALQCVRRKYANFALFLRKTRANFAI